ncbi:MAG: hypothetical protein ACXWV8_05050 [Chitinophagaceae bacterium]
MHHATAQKLFDWLARQLERQPLNIMLAGKENGQWKNTVPKKWLTL